MSHHQAILFWSVQLPSIRKSTQCKQLHDHQLLIKNFGHYLFISIHLEKLHNIDKFSCHWSLSLFYFLSFSEGCVVLGIQKSCACSWCGSSSKIRCHCFAVTKFSNTFMLIMKYFCLLFFIYRNSFALS